jgi:thiol:disulfide interchange protein DsbA
MECLQMMNRREFSWACAAALGAGAMGTANAQGGAFEPGKDYLPLPKPAPVDAPSGKVEVVEFFMYSCPHCNAFEPALAEWVKHVPKDVYVRRVAVPFDRVVPRQQLYYTLETMGLLERLHGKVFQAIHVERKLLDTPESIADWAATQGVNRAKFLEQFNSFSVSSKVSRGNQLLNSYGVEGVPALGVAGRFYTDGALTRNMDRTLQVVNYLVGEVRKGR